MPDSAKPNASPLLGQGTQKNPLAGVYGLVAAEFEAVNALIPRLLTSDVHLVEEIGKHIVESGGKRLRPLIVLLAGRACGYASSPGSGGESDERERLIRLATVIEFLHTATLLHDDVVDHSARRRGKATANAIWGNAPSVLVGDFLYSRAFELMVQLGNLDVLQILSSATNLIAEGEVLQLSNIGNVDLSEEDYRAVIRAKTALLFEASAHSAACLAKTNEETRDALHRFGLRFGMAYQLVDDVLDYTGDAKELGKNVGDDLAEGKATLPLIFTMREGKSADADVVRSALRNRDTQRLADVVAAVEHSGGVDYTRAAARSELARAHDALSFLPDNEYAAALTALTDYAANRLK